jgi:hypothetical protein
VGSAGPWNFEYGDMTKMLMRDYANTVRGVRVNA